MTLCRALLPLLAFVGACAIEPDAAPQEVGEADAIAPAESRLYASPGSEALLLIAPVDPLPGEVRVSLSDGRELIATPRRIAIAAGDEPRSWLPPAGHWSTSSQQLDAPAGSVVTTYLVVPMPADAEGNDLKINGRRIPVTWLTSKTFPASSAVAPPAILERLLIPDLKSPVRRWRYKLVTRTLLAEESATPSFEDPVLEALARQCEARWRHALSRLGREDPRVAARLVSRIGRLSTFAGRLVPAWPTSLADLDALLARLLDPGRTGAQLIADAEAFITGQRTGIAWITDDAGAQTASDRAPITAVACLNLDERPQVASCAWRGSNAPGAADLTTLAPAASKIFRVPRPPSSAAAGEIEARVGSWTTTLAALPAPIAARPPGVVIGPFELDWTLEGLAAGKSELGASPAMVRIFRSSQSDDWTMYVECARGSRAATPEREEFVRLWLGPTGRSRVVVTLSERSELNVESVREGIGRVPEGLAVSEESRWAARISVPSSCLESDGILLLGIERFDAAGVRTSAPRAMLPWQQEPGRVAIDTTTW